MRAQFGKGLGVEGRRRASSRKRALSAAYWRAWRGARRLPGNRRAAGPAGEGSRSARRERASSKWKAVAAAAAARARVSIDASPLRMKQVEERDAASPLIWRNRRGRGGAGRFAGGDG